MELSWNMENTSTYHTKREVITALHEALPTVGEYTATRKLHSNKYTELALKWNYKNYRVCSIANLSSLKLMKSFTENQKQFFNANGEFLAIFNEISGKPMSIIFRSLKEKQFVDFSMFYTIYGLDLINPDFRFGKWLILTEGIYDADSFRYIHPNIVAMLTSNITVMQAEVLSTLTNRFILAFDNDEGGRLGVNIAKKRLTDLNPECKIDIMPMFSKDKDLGVLEELLKEKTESSEDYTYRKNFYQSYVDMTVNAYGEADYL